jgi:8-hydroxy-5-deazaflavin:NADPH oxidoreductase
MRIGILGSGLMGGKLGTIFARAGHDVVFSYSHSREKLQKLAAAAGERATVGTPAEAIHNADVVVLAVHWTRVDDVLAHAGSLSGRILLSCTMPMSVDDSHMVLGFSTSGAEVLAQKVPGAHVVSAFSTVPSEVLFPVFERRGRGTPPDLIYCGDHKGAKKVTASLIHDVGFNPVDIGPLRAARLAEPFVLIVAQLAYNGSSPELAYRFERLSRHPTQG